MCVLLGGMRELFTTWNLKGFLGNSESKTEKITTKELILSSKHFQVKKLKHLGFIIQWKKKKGPE